MLEKPSDLQQISIDEAIADLGLPKSAKFIGYAIHRPDTEEFAVKAIENDEESLWAWHPHPQMAKLFDDYPDAYEIAAQYTKAPVIVGLIFDIGKQLFFAAQSGT